MYPGMETSTNCLSWFQSRVSLQYSEPVTLCVILYCLRKAERRCSTLVGLVDLIENCSRPKRKLYVMRCESIDLV